MIVSISNEYISTKVKVQGAELCSLKKQNDDLEYIWQADEKFWNRHAPLLFPIVGKLLDNEYIYKNKTYQMNQHGFARDSLFELVKKEDDYICLKLEDSKESLEVYPFSFTLYIEYRLIKNLLKISYKLVNSSDEEMYFSIGAHPAFNWPLRDTNKEDFFLEFDDTNELERLYLSTEGLDEQKSIIVLGDNRLSLDEKLFLDDALVIQNLKNKTISLKNLKDDRMIKMDFEGFPYLGIWSKPTGAPFICIEPWYGIADVKTHNKHLKDKRGILLLEAKEEFESSYSISI